MVDLLDARGYAVTLQCKFGQKAVIRYLGAVQTEHPEVIYEEDPYVVSCVENQEFEKEFQVALKDKGIRKHGLKVQVEAEAEAEIFVTVCGEPLCMLKAGKNGKAEAIVNVEGVCGREKEYLKNIHRILYILLAEIDRICTKYNLHYFLVFGGLLGVLRYGDIIPWDDDIDIAMPRDDFEHFKQIAPKELGEGFMYLDCADMGGGAFLDFMCRILYMKEAVPGNVFRKVSGRCRKELENHLPLDIFILDNASDSPKMHKLHMLMVRGVYGLGMGHRAYIDHREYVGKDAVTKISVRLLSAVGRFLPVKFIFWLHDSISMMYRQKNTKDYFMSNGFLPFIHTRYSREWFEGERRLRLGDVEACVPADVEAYLKRAYYDYFHYPPINKRIPEHSPEADGVF